VTPFWQSKPPIYLGRARRESLHAQAPHRAGDGLASGHRVNLLERYDYPFFNLSHSDGRALVAVACDEVGVDIERCTERADADRLLAVICSTQEAGVLQAGLPPDALQHTLYRLWTRKEAYCKAIGQGLGKAPDSFSVIESGPGGGAMSAVAEVQDATKAGRWRVHELPCAPGWAAALCARLEAVHIVQRAWTPGLPVTRS